MNDDERLKKFKEFLTGREVRVYIRSHDPAKARCISGPLAFMTTKPPYIIIVKDPNTHVIYVINWKEVAWMEVL